MERHPPSEENGGCDTRYDEKVHELGHIEKSEMHSGIFRMVAGSQFGFGFRQVERPPVHFRISCNQVYDKGYQGRNMSLEDEPSVGLAHHNFGELHGIRQDHDGQDGKSYRKFVADHLRSASHGTDERKLAVRAPSGKQDSDDADG